MAQAEITMYESMLCGYCRAARSLFKNKGWEYTSIGVDGQPAVRAEMEADRNGELDGLVNPAD